MADPTGYSPNFVQRVLEMFSPVRAAQDIKRSYNTFSDIVNNRGVTDQQVEDAGSVASGLATLGAVGTLKRFPRTVSAPEPTNPRAALSNLSPEVRAYGRGYQEGRGVQFNDKPFYLDDPMLAQAHKQGFSQGAIRPDLVELRGRVGAPMQRPAPQTAMPSTPVQSPQSLGQALQGNAPQSAPTVQRSPRFATPQKNDVVRRMAQGTPPEKFKTPAERKYAKDIANQAEVMGVPVDKMWEAIATGTRKRAWMAPPVAAGAAASSEDEFRRALAQQLMPVY